MQRLSWLDAYGNQLYRDYFSTFAPTPIDVTFEYDYIQLLGWLLKCSYNSSRSEGADVEAYRPFLPFLIGRARPPPHRR